MRDFPRNSDFEFKTKYSKNELWTNKLIRKEQNLTFQTIFRYEPPRNS